MKNFLTVVAIGFLTTFILSGCSTTGNEGSVAAYKITSPEPEWIRNGDPIEFEGELWYPSDTVDVLVDAEVILLGDYKGVEYFIQTADIKPYNRIYTKFGRNKFRAFEVKTGDDRSKRAL